MSCQHRVAPNGGQIRRTIYGCWVCGVGLPSYTQTLVRSAPPSIMERINYMIYMNYISSSSRKTHHNQTLLKIGLFRPCVNPYALPNHHLMSTMPLPPITPSHFTCTNLPRPSSCTHFPSLHSGRSFPLGWTSGFFDYPVLFVSILYTHALIYTGHEQRGINNKKAMTHHESFSTKKGAKRVGCQKRGKKFEEVLGPALGMVYFRNYLLDITSGKWKVKIRTSFERFSLFAHA